MHSSGFFRIKPIARLIFKCEISGSHTISDQSLLLSTIVLNDTVSLAENNIIIGTLRLSSHDYNQPQLTYQEGPLT